MRKWMGLAICVVVLAAAQSPALAQRVAAEPNWTGTYAGLSIGGRVVDSMWSSTNIAPTLAANLSNDPVSSAPINSVAPRFSAYAGYNWLVARNWIGGVEADVGWASNRGSRTPMPGTVQFDFLNVIQYANQPTATVSASWDASLRGRIGHLVRPDTLVFGTTGIAFQHVELNGRCPAAGGATDWCTRLHNETVSSTRLGWTPGAGVERMIGKWIMRGEYRYADFGTFRHTFFTFDTTVPFDDRLTANVAVRTHTATLGVAYKFGNR